MTKDGDDKGLDEHTRIGGAPPKFPGAPAPAAPPPEAPPALDEHTRLQGAPPPIPPRPPSAAPAAPSSTPAPSVDESTRLAAKPPAMPKPPSAPAGGATTVPQAAAPPPLPAGGGDFAEHTVLLADLQPQAVPAARLQRMQPPGRSDIVTLDRTHYLMGRLPSCDLRLYSQTASREHAQLNVRDGRWYLTPVTGKVVLVNGTQVKEEVPLTHKMRLQLGGDELIFLDESGVAAAVSEAPAGGATFGANRLLLLAIAALVLAVVAWLWATR